MKSRVLIFLLAICVALCFVACTPPDNYVKDSTASLKSDDESYKPPIFNIDIEEDELGGDSYGEYVPIP